MMFMTFENEINAARVELLDTQQRLERLIEQSVELDQESNLRQAIGQIKAARTFLRKICPMEKVR